MSEIIQRIKQQALEQGEALAIASDAGFMTYAELVARIDVLACQLADHQIRVIALALDNSSRWVELQLAALAADITLVPVPPFFSAEQVAHLLESCAPDLIFMQPDDPRFELSHAQPCPALGADAYRLAADAQVLIATDTALVTFTSGTTGTPKGVCISHTVLDTVCGSLLEVTEPLAVERHVCLLPLAVLLEHLAGVLVPLCSGALVMIYGPDSTGLSGSAGVDISRLGYFLQRQAPQSLILTPELLRLLVHLCSQGVALPALKFVAVGGGRVAPALLHAAREAGLPVYEGYGLSECGSVVALNLPGQDKPGSVGRVLPHCLVSISAQGEVLVSSRALATYLGDYTEPPECLATGDLGYLDDEGYLFISGRVKQVQINSFGRNFSPEWLEAELALLPGVRRAAVFGDQLPAVSAVFDCMQPLDCTSFHAALAALNQRLPDYARITHSLFANEPFSMANQQLTANGRIRRACIWQAYREQVLALYSPDIQNSFSQI